MWRERIQALTKFAVFKTPADRNTIENVEGTLKINIPIELRGLLSESNGVEGEWPLVKELPLFYWLFDQFLP